MTEVSTQPDACPTADQGDRVEHFFTLGDLRFSEAFDVDLQALCGAWTTPTRRGGWTSPTKRTRPTALDANDCSACIEVAAGRYRLVEGVR